MLRAVAIASGLYDIALGSSMLLMKDVLARAFGTVPPVPPIHADLNGLFLLAIGAGYALPASAPERFRGYLWIMGAWLKGAGAVAFVADVLLRHSPRSFLLFAATDAALAIATLWALLLTRSVRPQPSGGA